MLIQNATCMVSPVRQSDGPQSLRQRKNPLSALHVLSELVQ